MKTLGNILIFAVLFAFSGTLINVVECGYCYAKPVQAKKTPAKSVFKEIEEGIAEGQVDKISPYFSDQTYLSLSNEQAVITVSNQLIMLFRIILR